MVASRDARPESRVVVPASWGLALSGGGVRAAFYALGGMMYLCRSGLNRDVTFVASVSGGSIANAATACWKDFSTVDSQSFEEFVGRFSHRMASKGVFFWKGTKGALINLVILFTFPFIMIGYDGVIEGVWNWNLFPVYTMLYVVPMFLWPILCRGRIQRNLYAEFIAYAVAPDKRKKKEIAKSKLSDFTESTVKHILVATELTSGAPLYMSREMVYSPSYGTGTPSLTVAQAVYASAAFPIGFPPLRPRTADLEIAGGRVEDRPKRIVLADGGVFNNLGTDSFTAWDSVRRSTLVGPQNFPATPEQLLVINASSPPEIAQLSNFPVKRGFVAIRRIMSVLYENTLRPRVERLLERSLEPNGPIVIDIADSPIELCERMNHGDLAEAANTTLEQLRSDRSDSDWKEFATRAAKTKTVLSPIGEVAATRLIRLGYICTAVACSIRFKTLGLGSVPTEEEILSLIRTA